jgi:hypothetical protein
VLTTAIELTNMGPGAPPPSAFDFPTLARFLSTFPSAFLRTEKQLVRMSQWIARFEHLDTQHGMLFTLHPPDTHLRFSYTCSLSLLSLLRSGMAVTSLNLYTHMGLGTHLPSAFNFPMLSCFLSTCPSALLRKRKATNSPLLPSLPFYYYLLQ